MRAFSTGLDEDLPWLWQAAALAVHLWDDENWERLTARLERIARDAGNLNELPLVLHHRAVLHTLTGEFSAVAAMLAEIKTISDATGVGLGPYGDIFLAAWRGRHDHAAPLIANSLAESTSRGEGGAVSNAHLTSAVLFNGLAQYPAALDSALAAAAYPDEHGVASLALVEAIEAAARVGRPDSAAEAYELLRDSAEPNGTDWGLGILARATGLRSEGPAAEAAYQEGVERLSRTRMRMDLARTHLVYGEWLRREGRRQDARGQLRMAYKLFSAAGAGAFAERAGRELAATGEVLDERRTADSSGRDSLTAQEAHIADLAGAGLTNAEIGAQMFLSQHTVEWHLRKVFVKLGITSRKQLRP
jgi:DNA-binding CsgD family transcriptional regulator